jgi:hypothetical protein
MKSTINSSGFQSNTEPSPMQVHVNEKERRIIGSGRQPKIDFGAGCRLCQYKRLGTLGDPDVPGATCSEHVALRCGAKRVVGYLAQRCRKKEVVQLLKSPLIHTILSYWLTMPDKKFWIYCSVENINMCLC